MFEPFGHGNTKPIFALKNAFISDLRKVGKEGNHLSFKLTDLKELPDLPTFEAESESDELYD